ncbi:MAG: hypothetical protein FWE02_05305 [Defluviitaleaceae bacterium]|nr:hypothetical protein [Defluviitaleaceae bacterium]
MNEFESFSVKDIRKLRTRMSEEFEGKAGPEIRAVFREGAERAKKIIEELRKEEQKV